MAQTSLLNDCATFLIDHNTNSVVTDLFLRITTINDQDLRDRIQGLQELFDGAFKRGKQQLLELIARFNEPRLPLEEQGDRVAQWLASSDSWTTYSDISSVDLHEHRDIGPVAATRDAENIAFLERCFADGVGDVQVTRPGCATITVAVCPTQLNIRGQRLMVWSEILARHSRKFEQLLRNTDTLAIDEFDYATVATMVKALYIGRVELHGDVIEMANNVHHACVMYECSYVADLLRVSLFDLQSEITQLLRRL